MSASHSSSLSLRSCSVQDLLNCKATTDGKLSPSPHCLPTEAHEGSDLQLRSLTAKENVYLRAAYYWINQYQPPPSASPLIQVKGLLEAAYSLEKIRAWELISEILFFIPIAENQTPLHEQLGIWGLVHEQISLYRSLLKKVNAELDALCLNGLGNAYIYLSQYPKAVEYFGENLELAYANHNPLAQIKSLEGLGFCYLYWGKYDSAEQSFQQQLSLVNSLSQSTSWSQNLDREKSRAMAGLGYCMYFLRRFRKGVRYTQQSLVFSKNSQDHQSQWMALGAMAICYSQLGKHRQASECVKQRLNINHQSISRHDQLTALIDLAATYCYQLDFVSAIDRLEQVIAQAQALGNTRAQCQASMLLGYIYCWQGHYQSSIKRSQNSLKLAQEFGYKQFESQSYSQLSYVYSALGQLDKAIAYADQALETAQQVKSQNVLYQACGLMVLGLAKVQQGGLRAGMYAILASLVKLPLWAGTDSRIILAFLIKRIMLWCGRE